MKKCRITVMRITQYPDLMARYENPISHACDQCADCWPDICRPW